MRIVLVVGHGVVDIDALVIEQLRERNHGGVLEIFAKASGNEMHMYPGYVLGCEGVHIEKLRIFLCDVD